MRFLPEDRGVTAIEYGLIAALLAVGILVSLQWMGTSVNSNFYEVSGAVAGGKGGGGKGGGGK